MFRKILNSRWFLWLAGVGLLVLAAASLVEIRSGDPRRPGSADDVLKLRKRHDTNVLFILIDTLRAHRLSAYGYERETSPTLDYMASTGVRFARHLAQSSWTKCSMASLWTGLYPVRTGVLRSEQATPDEAILPAEILRDAGFRTAGIWRNGWVAPNFGFDQGFDVYERPKPGRPAPQSMRDNPNITLAGTDQDVVDAAIEFLRVRGRDRWFLYLHLMDVHQYVYDSDSALFGTSHSDVYDNSILHTDIIIGQLLTYLADENLLPKTIVAISSDHGEAFSERGLEGHARYVYRESTEVPFLLGFPFLLEPGVVIETRTRNVDVWPTLLDLVGVPPLPDTDGHSLVPQIVAAARGERPGDAPPAFAHLDRAWGRRASPPAPTIAVAQDGFRLVQMHDADGEVTEELFDRNTDPQELSDVLEDHPDVAARLRELASGYLASPPSPWGVETPDVEIDEMELNQLRALGYAVP